MKSTQPRAWEGLRNNTHLEGSHLGHAQCQHAFTNHCAAVHKDGELGRPAVGRQGQRRLASWSLGCCIWPVHVPACACVFTLTSSPSASHSPSAHRAPLIASLSAPWLSPTSSLRGFWHCSPAFPSIRILLHSCESFSKQSLGRERRELGAEGRLMQTRFCLLPPACPPQCPLPCT